MKVLFVGYRDMRHSKFGGYDYIAKFPDADYLDAAKLPFGFIPVGKRGKKLNLMFLDRIARLKSVGYNVVHYFYSDFMLFNNFPQKRNCEFVATVHMKSENFSSRQIEILKSFDKVVCLSSSEEKNLRNIGINAFFVPHGFNRPVFNNANIENFDKNKINLFYSGMNYRDFDAFVKIVDFSNEKELGICFYAVGQSKENKEKLFLKDNVIVCPRLSDDEYYSLLSLCDYNFLPMTFSTANNALLEAQSLGVSSVLPKISGVLDYASEKDNVFYADISELEKLFMKIRKKSASESLVDFSEKYAWYEIYKKLAQVYGANK